MFAHDITIWGSICATCVSVSLLYKISANTLNSINAMCLHLNGLSIICILDRYVNDT